MAKKKSKKKQGYHDENGYYIRSDQSELPDKWFTKVPPLRGHRIDFLLRRVADALETNDASSASTFMVTDFVGIMAENERLRRANKKFKIKLRKLTK